MLNKTMCLLGLSLLFTTSTANTKPMFVAEVENKVNLKEMVQTDLKNELQINKLRVHNGEKTSIDKWSEEQERIKAEKRKILEEERLKKQITEENEYNINFTLTYYGNSSEENGGYEGKTCLSKKLKTGMCASNVYKLGTEIETQDGRILTVSDVGGSDFNSPNRLDVYVDTYDDDVLNKLGRKEIKGRIIK